MDDGHTAVPTAALEHVSYLARSENRVVILDELTKGPAPRRRLADATGTSRTTLDRIVNELEDREWARRTADGEYEATAAGERLMQQFRPLVDSVEAIRRLGEAVTWLPSEELTIELHNFVDATVRRPQMDDPMAAIDSLAERIGDASTFRVLTHLAAPVPLSTAILSGLEAGGLSADFVVTDELLAYLRENPERRTRWRRLLDEGAEMSRLEGPIPCNLFLVDETVLIKQSAPEPIDESYGAPIVSENDTVRAWAHDLLDRFHAEGSRVDVETFDADVAVPRAESDPD